MKYPIMAIIVLVLSTIVYAFINKGKKVKLILLIDLITIFVLLGIFIIMWFSLTNINESKIVLFWSYTLIIALIINILAKIKMSINLAKQARD